MPCYQMLPFWHDMSPPSWRRLSKAIYWARSSLCNRGVIPLIWYFCLIIKKAIHVGWKSSSNCFTLWYNFILTKKSFLHILHNSCAQSLSTHTNCISWHFIMHYLLCIAFFVTKSNTNKSLQWTERSTKGGRLIRRFTAHFYLDRPSRWRPLFNSAVQSFFVPDPIISFGSKPEWIFRAGSNLGGRTGFFFLTKALISNYQSSIIKFVLS